MIEIGSFIGLSYAGKSTLAEGVAERLADEGLVADIIKKDAALEALGQERYGSNDTTGGYSIPGFLKHGPIPPADLHTWMNGQVSASLELGHIVLLEGGTRTRSAQAETLKGINLDNERLKIFILNLPFRTVVQRARQRRRQLRRYDDLLPIALLKLYGQYRGAHAPDAPQPDDSDVLVLDAVQPPVELIERVANEIFESHART